MKATVHLPLKKPLPSAANLREHWAAKARRVKAQRVLTRIALFATPGLLSLRGYFSSLPSTRIACTFTRVGPRALDSDNLQGAFKSVRDEVAKFFGLDDGSGRWAWDYQQARGEPAIRIELEVRP